MSIELEKNAPIHAYQAYIHALEKLHGWLDTDLVHNCFLMGEEVGELFKAVRQYNRYYTESQHAPEATTEASARDEARGADEASERNAAAGKAAIAEEIVDVLNYLIALANRLDIDLEEAFRTKNHRNQQRTWQQS